MVIGSRNGIPKHDGHRYIDFPEIESAVTVVVNSAIKNIIIGMVKLKKYNTRIMSGWFLRN